MQRLGGPRLIAVVVAALCAIGATLGQLVPETSSSAALENRVWLCGFGIAYALWRGLRPSPADRRLRICVLAIACLVGGLNYYRYDSTTLTQVGDHYDITFYYLNSKYFEELGYYDLYRGILLADEDGRQRLDHIHTIRDLHAYANTPRAVVMANTDALRARFTDARWRSFKHDVDYLMRKQGSAKLAYFFKDHGYNPPPTWTLVGRLFTTNTPVEQLKRITSIDILLITIMFGLVWRAFGLEAMLLGLLFMTATISGKWPVLGQALLRFDWLAALVGAMCCLRINRPATAGGLLAYAAMSRVFPAIYFFPFLVWVVRGVVKQKRIDLPARRFITAAAVVSALMVGSAVATLGSQAFVDSAQNLAMHGSSESYSSLRVGLGDALIYRGERYWQLLALSGSIPGKARELGELQGVTRGIGLLVLVLIGAVVWRRRDSKESITQLAYFAFFAITTPQINYHNSRLLLILWHAQGARPVRDTVGLCLLFAVELMGITAYAGGAVPYSMTSMSSVGLTLYGLFMLSNLAFELKGRGLPDSWSGNWRTPAAGAAAVFVLAATWMAYWQAGALPQAKLRLSLQDLAEVHDTGTLWRGPGARDVQRLDALGALVDLGSLTHARHIDISVDHDDRDRILFLSNGKVLGRMDFRGRKRAGRKRLSRRRLRVPDDVAARGYDAVRIVPMRGDRRFALGHLVLD